MDNSGSPEAAELSSEELELLAALFAADEQAQTTGPTSALRQTVEHLPLSFGQKRLWFLDQLEPGNPAYNIPFALHLRGPLSPAALECSLNEVVRRHEVLRTSFAQREDQLFQVIAPEQTVSIEQVDLRGSIDTDRQAQIRALAQASELHAFSLAHGPLLKATLARLDEEEWAFFLNIHHIVFDGWSIALFTREIIAGYEAYQTSRPVDLPPLPIQYADYAIWQQQQAQAERFEQHLAYWREQLANLPVLNLPTDEPRPSRRTSSGGALPVTIEASLHRQLTALSQQSGCTLFMTLLAAWQVLLSRYSSQLDIAVGSPVAGRLHSETEPLIGFFVNTLVLRTDLADNPGFRALLERVRRTTLTAFDHQMVPFDRLVEELQPERSLSHTPLVQTMFTLQNFGAETLNAAGLAISPLVFESKIAKFDLMLTLTEHPDGLHGELEYSTDLYRSPTIERMIGHFHTLITAICANPDQPVMRLPLLTAPEREQLLATWNATAISYPQVQSLVALIEAQVERTPDAVAVEFEHARLSYRELNRQSNQLAHHLRQLGVGPDVRVGVCVERSLEMVVGLLGVLKAGGAYIPLDPEYPIERLHYMLEHSQAPVLLTQQSLAHQLPGAAHVICLDAEWQTIERQPQTNPGVPVATDNLAYVIYTSGSTGLPKGVMISHRSLINHMQWMIEAFPLAGDDRVLQKTPFSFDASVWEFYAPLLTGARLVMARPGGHQEIDYLIEEITSRGITTLQVVPSVLKVLLEHGLDTCVSLTRVFCGGEALAAELADRFFERMSADLINLYGPTEATIETLTWQCSSDQRRQVIPIGRPISNVQAYILDAHQHLVPVGVPGELYLGGASLARGYLNRADVTAEKFIPDPFSPDAGAHLYRTGDLARYREHGVIEYLGRIDHQVKLRGFRIELGEIETVLRQHEAVRDAVVLPQNDRLVAYVVENQEPRTKNLGDEADGSRFLVLGSTLRAFLATRLPDYMIPSVFMSLPELPLTPNGKLDRQALPSPEDQPGDRESAYVAPTTELEQNLAAIWQAVLNVEQIGVHDSFFDRGGHSLLATQVVSRMRDTLQIELPLRALFETPTIAGMSQRIEAARRDDQQSSMPPLQRVSRDGPLPLSFAQQRLWFLDQLEPGNPFYNIHTALEVIGPLDRRAVERSLNAIVMRHEALRTTFAMRDDQPVQVIAPELSIELPIVDLRDLPEAVREAEAQRLAAEEAGQPFDLQHGPVLRARLLWLDHERCIMLLTMHHIVSDGWSMGVLVRELFACYQAYSAPGAEQIEISAVLPPLPIQYADFAQWQRQWLQGAVLEAQIDYWKRQLANLPVLELPTDRPRPPVLSFQGATQSFILPQELTSALLRVSQQHDATLFMTLLTAFQIVLARYSGQDDLAVGSPIANRTRRELEDLIGFFVNMLVLRTDLGGAPTIRQLLARVRATCLDAYAHQDLPFEQLVEELQPERSLSYNPLFQVGFALQNAPLDLVERTDLRLRPINVVQRTSTFDLSVFMSEEPDGIHGLLEYNTDLFDEATITRLVGHFTTVLAAIAADPDRSVAELPLLTETEHQQLADWNATAVPFAQQWVHERFEAQARQTPDAIALLAGEHRITYAALSRRSSQLAHYLRALGAGPDMRIGLYVDRSPELVIGLLAILKAGAAYVPLDPEYPRERLEFMRDDASIAILVTQASLRAQLAAPAVHVVCLDSDAAEIEAQPEHSPALAIPADTLAYVIYTSGSTGLPKGVMVEHQHLVNTLSASQAAFGFRPDDRMPCIASFSFDIAIFELFCPLLAGGSALLTTKQQILDLPGFARTLETVTVLHTLPSLMRQIAGFIRENNLHDRYGSLRQVFVGGDAVAPDLLAEIQSAFPSARINVLYGPTEATIICATHPVTAGELANKHLIGKPMSNTALRLYDRSGQLVPVGVPGELYIGGASVTRGYLQREALTAEKFVELDGQRWYRSGDLARFLPDGTLEFLGRIDQQVKIRGFRIELGEIEALLNDHPDVRDSVVLPRSDAPSAGGYPDTRLVGYVVPAASSPAHTAAQSAYVEDWQTLYDETYAEESLDDPTFHIVGWQSSYTGQPFPSAEMRAWRDATVDRIRQLAPQRVLEIGVGTGLLLFPLAGACTTYHGIDFSAPALAHIRRYLPPEWTHVSLAQRRADELGDLPPGSFDTVIINSVAQYFPSVEYLVQVISQAVTLLAPGGHLFVGDIRSQPLLQPFATAVVLARATPDTSRETAWSLVEQQVNQERELLLAPAFFHSLRQHLPRISDVQVEIKRGQDHNELTQFRYDVTLTVDVAPAAPQPSRQHHWLDESWTIERLAAALGDFDGDSLLLCSIPSARLDALVQAAALLHDPSGPQTVQDLHAELGHAAIEPVDPETLWSLGAELGYAVRVGWHENGAAGRYDAVFSRTGSAYLPPLSMQTVQPWSAYATAPAATRATAELAPRLRQYLKTRLPEHMIPAAFVALETLPLTPNGKVDRAALPAPSWGSLTDLAPESLPRTPVEMLLADIWRQVLSVPAVGIHQNFFDLGGHSLLATQVMSRVRTVFGVNLPVRTLFEQPTIALLSRVVTAAQREAQALPPLPPLTPHAPTDALPLSFAQQRLWFIEQLQPGTASYHVPGAWEIQGPIEYAAFQASLDLVVARQTSLRTTFTQGGSEIDGEPVQRIAPPQSFPITRVDLTASSTDVQHEVQRVIQEASTRPFDLVTGPLMRVLLIQLQPETHVFVLVLHHIITDGWSMGVLINELAVAYIRTIRKEPIDLPALPVQYSDYARWQRTWLDPAIPDGMLAAQLAYWQRQLTGVPTLDLPTDHLRPPVESHRGAMLPITLDRALIEQLTALSRQQGTTLFMTLLAGWYVLLARYSGQSDLAVGTPIAGRTQPETEPLIGFFINTLVLRTSLAGSPTFRDLLDRVRTTTLDAYAHQDAPFEAVVERLQPERDQSRQPLFQVLFALMNAPLPEIRLPEIQLTPLAIEHTTSVFDLSLQLFDETSGVAGYVEYATDLFDETTITRMIQHYQVVLGAMAASPDQPIAQVALLSEAERHQLAAWNASARPYPREAAVHQLIEAQVARTPNTPAIVYEGARLTYAELNARANQLAHHLRAQGVGPDVLVALMVERGLDMIV
ncbi:MAG TPA: amino acid adenylation domain-containing protein, partial [Herpetosiphonaceae bacterium]